MKKILYIAMSLVAVASFASCQKKAVATTPGEAAKRYAEHIKNDNYNKFVESIEFTEPVKPQVKKAVNKAHATALRTVHHPNVVDRGGIKEVKLVSETMAPDRKTCEVVLSNQYNNGVVETVNYTMVNDEKAKDWKIRVSPYKEVWRATTSDGDHEVVKVREGKEREFTKEKDNGEKQFVKDITKRDGQVEVIKTLENGQRSREVIKTLEEGNREIDKLKMDGNKIDAKDINRTNKEILKEKENIDGQVTKAREVIKK